MASVFFDPAVGGNGSTVTDDASPVTGLASGGHRTRFVPALSQVVAVAQTAVNSATTAQSAATSAINAPGTLATSTSSKTIGTGTQVFTIQTGKSFGIGQFMIAANTANPANYMIGQVTVHDPVGGILWLNVTVTGGSGTYAAWTISPTAAPVTGAVLPNAVNTFTARQVVTANDTAAAFQITQTGTGAALVVEDSSNPDSTPFIVNSEGLVITGHTSAITSVSSAGATNNPRFQMHRSDLTSPTLGLYDWSTNGGITPNLILSKSKSGTIGTRGVVAANDTLGAVVFCGDEGTAFVRSAMIEAAVDATPGTLHVAGRLVFSTSASGSSTPTERLRIDSQGNVVVTNTTGLLGYGTGSGGTVTQATSRTTGVTLNRSNGSITLVSAAGSTSWQSFTVTNSLVANTDTVIVNQRSGTDRYMIHVTKVNNGSFDITFATTGGTTTEQPVFNFAVLNGVTA